MGVDGGIAADFLNEHHGPEAAQRREVLIVDDEKVMAELTKDMVSMVLPSFRARTVLCPAEALVHLCGEGGDKTALMLYDWRMPFIPGTDLASMVKGERVDGLDVGANISKLRSSMLANAGGERVHPVDSHSVHILTKTVNREIVYGLRLHHQVVHKLRNIPTILHTGSPEAHDHSHPDGMNVSRLLKSGHLHDVSSKFCGVAEFAASIRKATLNAMRSRRK